MVLLLFMPPTPHNSNAVPTDNRRNDPWAAAVGNMKRAPDLGALGLGSTGR